MPIKWTDGPKKGTIEYVGAVLLCPAFLPQAGSPDWEPVYAIVWDPLKQAPTHIEVGWVGYANGASQAEVRVDATEHVVALVDNYHHDKATAERIRWEKNHRLIQLATLQQGLLVRVVRGRKVKKGTEGYVAWVGHGHFGEQARLQIGPTTVYIATSNLAVILTPAQLEEYTKLVHDLYSLDFMIKEHMDKVVPATVAAVEQGVTVS